METKESNDFMTLIGPGQPKGQVPPDLTVLGIDARTGCLGQPGSWRVVGSGKVTVYRGSDWTVYASGESLPEDV